MACHKCVFLILDGLGDLPASVLSGRTPLEDAETPVLNSLAAAGRFGLVDPIGPGIVPNTHSGCGALMGVLPEQLGRLHRGPVEASGAGYTLRPGDIAARANFATLEDQEGGLAIRDRRAGRIDSDTQELATALQNLDLGDGITADLLSTDQHRCVLVFSGPGLDPAVSDTDPGDRGTTAWVKACSPYAPEATLTAQKFNRFIELAHEILDVHPVNLARVQAGQLPANGVITRGAGAGLSLDNVVLDRGLSAAMVTGCNTVIGLARTVGYEVRTDRRFTAAADTDLPGKMEAALSALDDHDLVYVHIKAPDLFAHDHQPRQKRDFLQDIDRAMASLKKAGVMIALAADHSTDCNSGSHTADPVPALLYSPFEQNASPEPVNFGETACAIGNMPRQTSHELLLRVLAAMGFEPTH
jgi:2,3-bisphosphoglycerate-independent phosphoglycerate mutase